MAFCSKCGAQVADGVRFCSSCGNDLSGAQQNTNQVNIGNNNTNQQNMYQANMNQNNYGQQANRGSLPSFLNTLDTTFQYAPQDIAVNKVMAVLSYLGILWLIPYFAAKQSPFARFHVKQGFLVICAQLGFEIVSAFLCAVIRVPRTVAFITYYTTPGILLLILWLIRVAIWVMAILGIANAAQGKAKELPFIGKLASNFTFLN